MILATREACSLGLQEERASIVDHFGNRYHDVPIVLLREASFEEYAQDYAAHNPGEPDTSRVMYADGWFFYEVHTD